MVPRLIEQFGYLAVLALLGLAGFGVPIPEELTQLTAGFLAHEGWLRLLPAIVTCWLGIVGGDFAFYTLARRHGGRVLESRAVRRLLTPTRRAWLEAHFARHAFWTIAIARHASGLRLPAFALAALHGVRPTTFLLADGLSALVSVPLVVGAGFLFSRHLGQVHREIRLVELGILAALALGLGAYAVVRRRRRPPA
ncbi:MAG TPA: DedA family protein [Anaeromyxobacteraceae bacterium]|nr:DedA family protein [Anaeromyxobacteraceae bacterium]